MKVVVTGAAGFIGSAVCRRLKRDGHTIVGLDKLTYAGVALAGAPLDALEKIDVCDAPAVQAALSRHQPDLVMHLAAESHVDRSIDAPAAFLETNVLGTYSMLQTCLQYWRSLSGARQDAFRFHHISTDEVYGSLGDSGLFTEATPYSPRSPYAASKAASDHLVEAWRETYGLPTLVSNCSNNYGPYHYPEKLIPLAILNALEGKPIGLYGDGKNVRDWLYVEDHADALVLIATKGVPGSRYNVGAGAERTNMEVAGAICAALDKLRPRPAGPYGDLIKLVADRPGHDFRYAMDYAKIERELGWRPTVTFEQGIERTIEWYLRNEAWWGPIRRDYGGERLGAPASRPVTPAASPEGV